jgi:hypothetical protein
MLSTGEFRLPTRQAAVRLFNSIMRPCNISAEMNVQQRNVTFGSVAAPSRYDRLTIRTIAAAVLTTRRRSPR